jgi:2-(1,2-epoxy-1,2-dihydrophenyl)acetyl-CoA isomerase
MKYETIRYRVENDIALITLNRPKVMNALTVQMRAEIENAFLRAAGEARVVVMTGKDKAFCTGQDLGDRANAADVDMEQSLKKTYEPMLKAIFECPIPTISAVNGPAAGAGANLALAADIVIASESAYFLQAFGRIGLIPDAGGTYTMPRSMGFAKALGASLFAEKIPAKKADEWGLIWEAVADDKFEETWRSRAEFLAKGPTLAFSKMKLALRESWNHNLDEQLAMEAKIQGKVGRSRDFLEGVSAFLEKRPAKFEGR